MSKKQIEPGNKLIKKMVGHLMIKRLKVAKELALDFNSPNLLDILNEIESTIQRIQNEIEEDSRRD